MQNSHFKYLTISDKDKLWGIYTTVVGFSIVPPKLKYPIDKHPESYYFHWKKGRFLNEYQLIYISKGSGILEIGSNKKYSVQSGEVFLIFPEIWHRYKPDFEVGWTEYSVGFSGDIVHSIFKNKFINANEPIYQIGYNEEIIKSIMDIINLAKMEKTYYQQYVSSEIIGLLGKVIYISKNRKVEKQIETNMRKAKLIISQSFDKEFNTSQVCLELNMSYSKFRKAFKKYVGISPGQYQMQLKINKSKELLATTDASLKEISVQLGFNNEFHFNTFFKNKIGISPGRYRNASSILR